MKHISSAQNPVYKNLKMLATSAKARREQRMTILEGIHLAESYLQAGLLPTLCAVSDAAQTNPEVSDIITRLKQREDIRIIVLSDQQFKTLSSVTNGIGLLFVIHQPAANKPAPLKQSALLLDNVQDPGNVGAILRTAAAAGVSAVYCSEQTAAVWAPKVLRAGMGAHFGLDIYEQVDLHSLITSAEIPVYATSLQATQTIYEIDLSTPAAWIVGNEGQGVSEDLLKRPVRQVIIPQQQDVESLNVAAATAVCLFEQRRQLLAKNRL